MGLEGQGVGSYQAKAAWILRFDWCRVAKLRVDCVCHRQSPQSLICQARHSMASSVHGSLVAPVPSHVAYSTRVLFARLIFRINFPS